MRGVEINAPAMRFGGSRPLGLPVRLTSEDEFFRAKRELLQAEVRLANARATVVAAEIDIKILNARLKALVK
jgi:hypothetical protein